VSMATGVRCVVLRGSRGQIPESDKDRHRMITKCNLPYGCLLLGECVHRPTTRKVHPNPQNKTNMNGYVQILISMSVPVIELLVSLMQNLALYHMLAYGSIIS
jgi:hypothetical protein